MYTYKKYCYVDGKLEWMISSEESFETKDEAISGAREAAKQNIPWFSHGEYEETEDGAKTWYSTPNFRRIHMKYVVN